jgi:hypothetical protein
MAADGGRLSCRWQAAHSYTRGRWNGVSPDANRADQWFLAVYLMGRDKRGVSAKYLQREFPEANLRSRTFHESVLLG